MWKYYQMHTLFKASTSIHLIYAPKTICGVFLLTTKLTAGSRLRGCYVPLKDDDSGVTEDHENTQVYTNNSH
jgi:hypothetical protein